MATPVQHQAATSYGAQGTPIVKVMPPPVVPNPARSPATTDIKYLIGQTWVNNSNNTAWMLSSKTTTTATWIALGSGATGGVVTLTGDSGGAISPTAGNINTLGTANQITVTGSGSTLTWTLPSAITAPGSLTTTTTLAATTTITAGTGITSTTGNIAATAGSVTAGTTLTATLGDITATNGNLNLSAAGNKLNIHATTAASDSVGVSGNMSGTPGAVTVTTSACTASSVILFSRKTTGGTPGQVSITAQAGGSFTLTSTGNETSTFNYLIIN